MSITGEEKAKERAWYKNNQMPIVAYSSLGRGLFSGRFTSADDPARYLDDVALRGYGCADNYERLARCEELAKKKHCSVSQLALAWLFQQELNVFAVCAMSSTKRMAENAASLRIALSPEESQYLNLESNNPGI